MKEKFASYFFLLMGIGILVGSFLLYRSSMSLLENSVETTGVVVALRSASDSAKCPDVQFTSKSGKIIKFSSDTCKWPPPYSVGEKVDVLYRLADPSQAKIHDFSSLWEAMVILGIIGALFVKIGIDTAFLGK